MLTRCEGAAVPCRNRSVRGGGENQAAKVYLLYPLELQTGGIATCLPGLEPGTRSIDSRSNPPLRIALVRMGGIEPPPRGPKPRMLPLHHIQYDGNRPQPIPVISRWHHCVFVKTARRNSGVDRSLHSSDRVSTDRRVERTDYRETKMS